MKNIFNKKGTGAEIDIRPPSEQIKDYDFREVVASVNKVDWYEKPEKDWRSFPIFDQNGSGSCVAQTLAKMLGIMYWLIHGVYVHFSATHIYQRRSNKPNGGMIGVEAFEIVRKGGATLEVLVPSQKMTDRQMDSVDIHEYKKRVGEIFKIGNHIGTPVKDIDLIASIIQTTKKPIMTWCWASYSEWDRDVPIIKDENLTLYTAPVRHSITVVDFTLYKGKKALIIEDSWGAKRGKAGRRIITEDFFEKRNWFNRYFMNFVFNDEVIEIPSHKFSKKMYFGENNDEIKALQDFLKALGLFPTNIGSTGFYGAITAKAVYNFQVKYKVADMGELNALQGRIVGDKTLSALNKIKI